MIVLDLRPMPPFSHDPRPLRYQFMVEYKDKFDWQYVQSGPKDWVVDIKRTAD